MRVKSTQPSGGDDLTAEKFVDGAWVACAFEELRKGDHARLLRPDGTLQCDSDGASEILVNTDPEPCDGPTGPTWGFAATRRTGEPDQ